MEELIDQRQPAGGHSGMKVSITKRFSSGYIWESVPHPSLREIRLASFQVDGENPASWTTGVRPSLWFIAMAATKKTRRERRVGPWDTARAFLNVSFPWASTKEAL